MGYAALAAVLGCHGGVADDGRALSGEGSGALESNSEKEREEPPKVDLKVVSGRGHFRYPKPVVLQVALYGPEPISAARVRAEVESPSGEVLELLLSEGFLPAGTLPESGSYAVAVTDLEEDGRYQVVLHADDNGGLARVATPFGEDSPVSSSDQNGGVRSEPIGSFKVSSAFAFSASGYEGAPELPPLRVTSLYAEIEAERCVRLSWQVPPNVGQGATFEIRYSTQSFASDEVWRSATATKRAPYERTAGETQTHLICEVPKGTFYFALRSTDISGNQSEVSNDYIVVID